MVALANLVVGIAVFSLSTVNKQDVWNSMTKVDTHYFNNNFDTYQVSLYDNQAYYTGNMVFIGIFMIVELIIWLVTSFVFYLLQSSINANSFMPEIGNKPFSQYPFIDREKANFKPWEVLDGKK